MVGTLIVLSVMFGACAPKVVETLVEPEIVMNNEANLMSPDALTGKKIYHKECTGCHEAKNITSYTQAQWASILPEMIEAAHLNEEESGQVRAYIHWELDKH